EKIVFVFYGPPSRPGGWITVGFDRGSYRYSVQVESGDVVPIVSGVYRARQGRSYMFDRIQRDDLAQNVSVTRGAVFVRLGAPTHLDGAAIELLEIVASEEKNVHASLGVSCRWVHNTNPGGRGGFET